MKRVLILPVVLLVLALSRFMLTAPATGPEAVTLPLITAQVTKTVDGDTVHTSIKQKNETIRLIGIDTPEIHHPPKPVQPYGPEAEQYTRRNLERKTVFLEKDTQERDRYGRLLTYIWISKPDKTSDQEIRDKMFNARLLIEGYAKLMTVPPNVKYADFFSEYQAEARKNRKGLWKLD